MSKERAFLKKLRYASLLENDLRKELEELLAQPEQTEQEPVAWGVYDPDSDLLISIYGYKEKPDKVLKDRFKWAKLYAFPLTRKPLSDEWIKNNRHFIHQDVSFTELVRGIEKAHDIGGGE